MIYLLVVIALKLVLKRTWEYFLNGVFFFIYAFCVSCFRDSYWSSVGSHLKIMFSVRFAVIPTPRLLGEISAQPMLCSFTYRFARRTLGAGRSMFGNDTCLAYFFAHCFVTTCIRYIVSCLFWIDSHFTCGRL